MPSQPPQIQPNIPPANVGASEPDGMPMGGSGGAPSMVPDQSQGSPANIGSSEPDGGPIPGQGADNSGLQQKLDGLSMQDKKFLAQYMTPEFNYALGLVAGPEVAQYLNQYTDQNKVLVPVSRQEAARIQDAVKQDQQAKNQGGQGSPQPAPAQGMPQGQPQQPAPQMAQSTPSMAPAAPQPAPAQPQQAMQLPPQGNPQLPNGVTPAPMQHGIMAPMKA